jgi:hypothetical protein
MALQSDTYFEIESAYDSSTHYVYVKPKNFYTSNGNYTIQFSLMSTQPSTYLTKVVDCTIVIGSSGINWVYVASASGTTIPSSLDMPTHIEEPLECYVWWTGKIYYAEHGLSVTNNYIDYISYELITELAGSGSTSYYKKICVKATPL